MMYLKTEQQSLLPENLFTGQKLTGRLTLRNNLYHIITLDKTLQEEQLQCYVCVFIYQYTVRPNLVNS